MEVLLALPGPFAGFKHFIDRQDRLRTQWFAFKQARYAEWVAARLARLIEAG